MSEASDKESDRGVRLPPESSGGLRHALALILVVTGSLALVGSGLCTIYGLGMIIVALVEFGDWTLLAMVPVALIIGGVGFFVSYWVAKAGLRLLRG